MIRSAVTKFAKPPYVWVRKTLAATLFDRRLGVDTEGTVCLSGLDGSDSDAGRYRPTGLFSLRRILPRSEVSDRDVLVDFGSGKGRVVLQAALYYPLQTVYGVELSEALHEVAQRNVRQVSHRLRCSDVRLECTDARNFEIPEDTTIAFFYNPFATEVFTRVFERLLRSIDRNPRPFRIIYGNPVDEAVLLRSGRVRLIRELRGHRPSRDWSRSNSYRLYEVS